MRYPQKLLNHCGCRADRHREGPYFSCGRQWRCSYGACRVTAWHFGSKERLWTTSQSARFAVLLLHVHWILQCKLCNSSNFYCLWFYIESASFIKWIIIPQEAAQTASNTVASSVCWLHVCWSFHRPQVCCSVRF